MKLLVDIGNQRLKWRAAPCSEVEHGACEGAFATHGADFEQKLAQQWDNLRRPQSVWICSVAGGPLRRQVGSWLRDRWSLDPNWVTARAEACGVRNTYFQPETLGSDRWAALIGARALAPGKAAIVVDCGTAITVDALSGEGVFLGGVIFPGLAAMHASLQQDTGEIRLPQTEKNVLGKTATAIDALGQSTLAAVTNGILCAAAGGIGRALEIQQSACDRGCCALLTGGDAARLQPLLSGEFELLPDLVLQGLAVIAEQDDEVR